jgi:hypothetical protein
MRRVLQVRATPIYPHVAGIETEIPAIWWFLARRRAVTVADQKLVGKSKSKRCGFPPLVPAVHPCLCVVRASFHQVRITVLPRLYRPLNEAVTILVCPFASLIGADKLYSYATDPIICDMPPVQELLCINFLRREALDIGQTKHVIQPEEISCCILISKALR